MSSYVFTKMSVHCQIYLLVKIIIWLCMRTISQLLENANYEYKLIIGVSTGHTLGQLWHQGFCHWHIFRGAFDLDSPFVTLIKYLQSRDLGSEVG